MDGPLSASDPQLARPRELAHAVWHRQVKLAENGTENGDGLNIVAQ